MIRPVCLTCPCWDDPGCMRPQDCDCDGDPAEAWAAYRDDYRNVDWDWVEAQCE